MAGPFDPPGMSFMDPYATANTGGGMGGWGSPFASDPAYKQHMMWEALTNAGLGLMQASGPSPYPKDYGTMFGGLAGGAAAGMQGAEDKYLKRALTGSQVQTAQQKILQGRMLAAALGGGVGGQPTAAGAAPVAPGGPQAAGSSGDPAAAIASVESGGQPAPYEALGPDTPMGRAHGRYQVMPPNIGPWTKEVLGQEMTPQQFLADPKAQDAVFNAKFGQYVQKYGSPQAASRAWFAGEGGMNNPNARDVNGTTVASYADRFNRAYNGGAPPAQTATAPAVQPTPVSLPGGPGAAPGVPGPIASPPVQLAQGSGGDGSGTPVTPPQAAVPAPAGKTLSQIIQTIPPAARSIIAAQAMGDPEKALGLMMKYVDPDKVPAFNSQTQEFQFVDKTDLGKNPALQPVDAAQFSLALKKEAREAANAKVVPGPGGALVPNAPLLEFDKGVSAAQGTDAEGKIRVATAEDAIKRNSDWQKAGIQSQSTIHNLGIFEKLAGDVKTGRFTGTMTDLKAAMKGAGMDLQAMGIPDNVAPAQAMQMISQRFALEMRQDMPGPMSDGDRKFMVAGAVSIERDPNANKIMAEWLRGNAQRNVDRAKAAREYMQTPEFSKNPAGIDDYVDKKLAGKDYFNHGVLPKANSLPMPGGGAPGVRRWNIEKGALE